MRLKSPHGLVGPALDSSLCLSLVGLLAVDNVQLVSFMAFENQTHNFKNNQSTNSRKLLRDWDFMKVKVESRLTLRRVLYHPFHMSKSVSHSVYSARFHGIEGK